MQCKVQCNCTQAMKPVSKMEQGSAMDGMQVETPFKAKCSDKLPTIDGKVLKMQGL